MENGGSKVSRTALQNQVRELKSVLQRCRNTYAVTDLKAQPKKEEKSRL